MEKPHWIRRPGGRERWSYVKYVKYPYDNANTYPLYLGYIIKTKNKHRCRDWLVYTQLQDDHGEYVGALKDMMPDEAKATAQLLIGAQQ